MKSSHFKRGCPLLHLTDDGARPKAETHQQALDSAFGCHVCSGLDPEKWVKVKDGSPCGFLARRAQAGPVGGGGLVTDGVKGYIEAAERAEADLKGDGGDFG